MFESWDEPLADEQRDSLLRKLAFEIKKRKMEAPAILFFETHRPLSFLGSQAGIALSPFLVPFAGIDRVRDYSRLFQDRANVDRLLLLLEGPLEDISGDAPPKDDKPISNDSGGALTA
jgi:hypothetical protein